MLKLADAALNTQSRVIMDRLRALKASEHEIRGCEMKSDLLALLQRYQRATPQTMAKSSAHAKLEGSSSSAGASLFASKGGNSSGGAAGARYGMGESGVKPSIPPHASRIRNPMELALSAQRQRVRQLAVADQRQSAERQQVNAKQTPVAQSGRSRGNRCLNCGYKPRKCRCHAVGRHAAGGSGGVPYGHGGGGVGEEGAVSKAQEMEDLEVGLSHKDADEQTFTEYVPHTFSGVCAFVV